MTKQQLDEVFGQLAVNYGVAGPVFIQYVVAHTEAVRRMLTKMQEKIDQELGFDQSDRYYSSGLACAFTAALIAKKCGLIDHDIPRIYQYAIATTRQMKATQDALIGNAAMVAQETLTAFINENVNNALVIDSAIKGAMPPAPIQSPRGQLRMRYEPNTKELFVTAGEYRKFFTGRQVDVRESLRHLAEAGIAKNKGLAEVKRIGAGAVGSMSGLGVRCYVFDGAAIGIDENHFKQADDPGTV